MPKSLRFRDLETGARFRFESETTMPNSGMVKGPWVKLGSHKYIHADGTLECRVGTILAPVVREITPPMCERCSQPSETRVCIACEKNVIRDQVLMVFIHEDVPDSHAYRMAEMVATLWELTQFAVGNRGKREGNPYGFPAVRDACELIARVRGRKDLYSWNEGVR